MRHGIDGKPVEPLSPDDRSAAQQHFARLTQPTQTTQEPRRQPDPPPPMSKTAQIRAGLLSRAGQA
jgi:hypothetical protein